jgi:hypothetical protein
MSKFRKKPVVIEAFQIAPYPPTITAAIAFESWAKSVGFEKWNFGDEGSIKIETLEGTMTATPGDWIIKGVAGEFYSCKQKIFTETYESADE